MHGLDRTHLPTNAIVADALAECAEAGLLEELRAALNPRRDCPHGDVLQAVRDLVYELAGASDHDLAVDVSHFFAFMELRLLNELPTQARRIYRLILSEMRRANGSAETRASQARCVDHECR